MARAGNHGVMIPRDRALLHKMYWIDKMNLSEIAEVFGVQHKSVSNVMKQVGVPTLGKGKRHPQRECKVCGEPVKLVKHAGNGSWYGSLCAEHRRLHRNKLSSDYIAARPDVQEKRQEDIKRWYIIGASQPKGEVQWLRKGKHLLRTARRILGSSQPHHAVSQYLNVVSAVEASSRISCRASSATSWRDASPRKSATPRATRAGSS